MSRLSVTDYKFADLLSQAFFNVHPVLLQIFKETLESSLVQLRNQGNRSQGLSSRDAL